MAPGPVGIALLSEGSGLIFSHLFHFPFNDHLVMHNNPSLLLFSLLTVRNLKRVGKSTGFDSAHITWLLLWNLERFAVVV